MSQQSGISRNRDLILSLLALETFLIADSLNKIYEKKTYHPSTQILNSNPVNDCEKAHNITKDPLGSFPLQNCVNYCFRGRTINWGSKYLIKEHLSLCSASISFKYYNNLFSNLFFQINVSFHSLKCQSLILLNWEWFHSSPWNSLQRCFKPVKILKCLCFSSISLMYGISKIGHFENLKCGILCWC